MVISRKRKETGDCRLLDDSPKRTKVHAQRKFAQGSNINSPVLTPITELERQDRSKDVLPEPQELLPMHRPHTEDFLTFLCFRGTSLLPPNLNFFNSAPVVNPRLHVQPKKCEPLKVGSPVATTSMKAENGTTERPFIAFGVRKRADPILVSKQMDKKRRHALALQALRRKYQEQKMAKLRDVAITKLSEKVTSKSLVKTRSITKDEDITKKSITHKTKVKIVATKSVQVMTRTLNPIKCAIKPIKQPIQLNIVRTKKNMCLRSFRGRFVQQELKVKGKNKKPPYVEKVKKQKEGECGVEAEKKKEDASSEYSSGDDEPLLKATKAAKSSGKVLASKVVKMGAAAQRPEIRVTRSHPLCVSSRPSKHSKTVQQKKRMQQSTMTSKSKFVKYNPLPIKRHELRSGVNPKAKMIAAQSRGERMRLRGSKLGVDLKGGKKYNLVRRVQSKKKVVDEEETTVKKETKVVKKGSRSDDKEVKTVGKERDAKPQQKEMVESKTITVKKKKVESKEERALQKGELRLRRKTRLFSREDGKVVNEKEHVTINEKETKSQSKSVKLDEKLKSKEANTLNKNEKEVQVAKQTAKTKDDKSNIKEQKSISDPVETAKVQKEIQVTRQSVKIKEDKSITKAQKPADDDVKPANETKVQKEVQVTKHAAKTKDDKASAKEQKVTSDDAKVVNEAVKVQTKKETAKPKEEKQVSKQGKVVKADNNVASEETKICNNKKEQVKPIEEKSQAKKEVLIKKPQVETKTQTKKPPPKAKENEDNLKSASRVSSRNDLKYNPEKGNLVKMELKSQDKKLAPKCSKLKTEKDEPKVSQRPTRKTKEAAAIYMELLGHRLVNDGDFDDDNISIDSFPELPNVRKTEQRELELKAKVKSKINITGPDHKDKGTSIPKIIEPAPTKLAANKKDQSCEPDQKPKTENVAVEVKESDLKQKLEAKMRAILNSTKLELSGNKLETAVQSNKTNGKTNDNNDDKDKNKTTVIKASTKNSQTVDNIDAASASSLPTRTSPGIDVKSFYSPKNPQPPTIKKIVEPKDADKPKVDSSSLKLVPASTLTPPIVTKPIPKSNDLHTQPATKDSKNEKIQQKALSSASTKPLVKTDLQLAAKTCKEVRSTSPFTDSDSSVASSFKKRLALKIAKPKAPRKKSERRIDNSFSDSDEEPLSKLTLSKKSVCDDETSSKLSSEKAQSQKSNSTKLPNAGKQATRQVKKDNPKAKEDASVSTTKPKRECTKKNQSYLFFSSSDDEDKYFHGFVQDEAVKAVKNVKQLTKRFSPTPQTVATDLLCRDVDKRFGKGKVNMSNEQIEQWLKDSAMAGNDLKKEQDESLKFDKTPSDHDNSVDTKPSPAQPQAKPTAKRESPPPKEDIKSAELVKPLERKTIFRKERNEHSTPNVNAFSPENESSVYAFEAECDEMISTPFRRPMRRPSSTATSRSEDSLQPGDPKSGKRMLLTANAAPGEDGVLLKQSAEQGGAAKLGAKGASTFVTAAKLVAQSSTDANKSKSFPSTSMYPPASVQKRTSLAHRTCDRLSENSDDHRYKVPSSPSASSSSSTKAYSKRQNIKARIRSLDFVVPVATSSFPTINDTAMIVEAPVFHPTEKEFQDPIEYITKIQVQAEKFGICRVVPPSNFKPECKVADDMRFTAYNQYVHKMMHRWGPNFKELMAITKYLKTQNITMTQPPWIGGMEIDLPRLYQTVQSLGGLKEVIERKKWSKVSELMRIPKSAQDRVTKLDDIYCKYLLPYDTLSSAEREKLFDEVETEWAKRESRALVRAQRKIENREVSPNSSISGSDDEAEECIVKGRNMALNAFYRIARNTMSTYFKTMAPSAQEVEQEFWKHVTTKQNHICVHSGSIDSGNWGYGFAVSKSSPFARHAWNLKVLTNNSGSVLRSMGPIMGVTVPTLHVGMAFSACCWYRDPHSLPWIEYLHTGGSKIWYGIPDSMSKVFHAALLKLVPNYCRNKLLWLPSDTAMIPPAQLIENSVSLCRTTQNPGEFIVVFPKAFTSSICTGYTVSESVYFAPPPWLNSAQTVYDNMRSSCEPPMFSLERLLISIATDARSSIEVLRQIVPAVAKLADKEKQGRSRLSQLGLSSSEKLPMPDAPAARKRKKMQGDSSENECDVCSANLFVSWVNETQEEGIYCLEHAAEVITNKKVDVQSCKLLFIYSEEELADLIGKIKSTIEMKIHKKALGKPIPEYLFQKQAKF